jgi:prolyl-tRNA synthetase
MVEKLNLQKSQFSDWWDKVISYAKVLDDRYPIKGVYVWMPYGHKAVKLMINKMESLLDQTGHQETYFPLFSPASVFAKEKDFLAGFGGESLVVTKIGRRDLDEEMIVRPTSETIIYSMLSLWIRSWRDLPMKLYQTVPIFRWETKMTKPMIRCREISKFNEAHCAMLTEQGANTQVNEAIKIYKEFFDFLQIPYIILKTPNWDTFAGAIYNYDFFTIMPDGKSVELASVINLGQKFSKSFDISYLDKSEQKQHAWQVTYGISERALGASLALHGDDKGLVFPSEIAPIQVVFVPILKGNPSDNEILEACNQELPFRVFVDTSDKRPGEKFNHWEVKGVPIRIDIGERDLASNSAVLVRRDTGEKMPVPLNELEKKISTILETIDSSIYKKAQDFVASMINEAKDLRTAQKLIKKGAVKLPWCGDDSCGQKLEEQLTGSALGISEETPVGDCICGKKAKSYLYFARSY